MNPMSMKGAQARSTWHSSIAILRTASLQDSTVGKSFICTSSSSLQHQVTA
jgi:hypothetical protein